MTVLASVPLAHAKIGVISHKKAEEEVMLGCSRVRLRALNAASRKGSLMPPKNTHMRGGRFHGSDAVAPLKPSRQRDTVRTQSAIPRL